MKAYGNIPLLTKQYI